MKYTFVALVLAAFLVSTLATTPAKAASKSDGTVQLQANDQGNKNAKNDEVVNGEDKPKRSKKNDDKDEDEDDGNSGGGNDDQNGDGE